MIVQDIKTVVTLSTLFIWDLFTVKLIGAIFILFDLKDMQLTEEYAKIVFWFLGAISLTVYSVYRAIDMRYKSQKSKLEKEILERKIENSEFE